VTRPGFLALFDLALFDVRRSIVGEVVAVRACSGMTADGCLTADSFLRPLFLRPLTSG
jgi:hypothetical protein